MTAAFLCLGWFRLVTLTSRRESAPDGADGPTAHIPAVSAGISGILARSSPKLYPPYQADTLLSY